MNITISGHQLDSSDALDAHINKKTEKLASHFQDLTTINIILSKDKGLFKSEINSRYEGKSFSVATTDIDMYQSVSESFKKLDARLKSHKSIRLSHRHNKNALASPELEESENAA